ncbi:MAG: hypothetical protein JNM93_08310 [Bacteriovoracaceae bacterium]|nr:hypothetical protein [Bacteriovoracaceae bacterium]
MSRLNFDNLDKLSGIKLVLNKHPKKIAMVSLLILSLSLWSGRDFFVPNLKPEKLVIELKADSRFGKVANDELVSDLAKEMIIHEQQELVDLISGVPSNYAFFLYHPKALLLDSGHQKVAYILNRSLVIKRNNNQLEVEILSSHAKAIKNYLEQYFYEED